MTLPSRKTLRKTLRLKGRGIHTGKEARLTLEPRAGGGLRFYSAGVEIPADGKYLGRGSRGTDLHRDGAEVKTVEHLLSACLGCGLSDAALVMEGPEVPGLDGSALEFSKAILDAGLEENGALAEALVLDSPLRVEKDGARLEASPADSFILEYKLSYPQYPVVAEQNFRFDLYRGRFLDEVAPARTFCLDVEVDALRKAGLAQGGSLDTAVVAGPQGYLNPSVRFTDEPCRHKVLDLLGDLALLGRPLLAHVKGDRSGHKLNGELVKALQGRLALGSGAA